MYRPTPNFVKFHDKCYLEGWAAAVAVGVGVAASAASAYATSSSKDAAANVPVPTLHSYTPTLATQNQYAGIQGLTGAVNQYGGAANNAAQTENSYYRQSINALAPGTTQGLYLAGKNANQELSGQIPADVVAATQRADAQTALTGGTSGSELASNLTARDLGLTSLNLTQMGAQGLSNNTKLAQSLTPYSAGDMLGTSAGYQQNYDQYQMANTNTLNQAAAANAGIQNQNAQNQYQQQVNQALAPNPYAAAGLAAAGSVSSGLSSYYGKMGAVNGNNYQPGTSGNYGFSNQSLSDIYGAANAGYG